MMNERGQMAEGINTMYRLFMVSVVAFIVFGVGSFVYSYQIDVRDAEAHILAREIVNCLTDDGSLDLSGEIDGMIENCGVVDIERAYVGVEVVDLDGKEIASFSEGDSGALWMKDLYGKVVATGNSLVGTEGIGEYEPGYYKADYFVVVLSDNRKFDGKMKLEVLINYANE
jgi:hypothetical protein